MLQMHTSRLSYRFLTMKTFTTVVAFIFSLLALVAAAPVLVVRDVWVPPIITPTANTVWKAGGTYEVTWDTSTKPDQVTNSKGEVVLSKAGRLDIKHPLASGFDLQDGKVNVTIPADTSPADDYAIVLFGDSGNASPEFTIKGSKSSSESPSLLPVNI